MFQIANAAYLRLIGRADVIGQTVVQAIPETREQGFLKLLDAAYISGERFLASAMPISLNNNAAQGISTQRYLDFLYQPLRDANGNVDGIFVEGYDVTEQHHAHLELARLNAELGDKVRRLEQAERRQKFQLELADLLRPTFPATDVVAAACQLLGRHLGVARVVFCEVDDLNGSFIIRSEWCRNDLPTLTGTVRPLDDFGVENIAVLRAGKVFACADTATDARTIEHAAAYAAVNVIASLAIPLVDGGRFTTILSLHQTEPYEWTDEDITIARDMAERTWSAAQSARAQAELRDERDHSQYIFENMAEGFGMIDADWRVVHMNAEGLRLGHRSAAEVIGKNHWEVWPEVRDSELERVYRRVLTSGVSETFEQLVPVTPDTQVWLELRAHRTLGGELAVFYHNISDRKAIENTLHESSRQKDTFLAMLAHELRNPLAPISAAAELLPLVALDRERVCQIGDVIKRQAAHMTSLIQDLLDVSRVTQGLVTLSRQPVDVRRIASEAIEQVRPLLDGHRHRFSLQQPPESVWVDGDRERLVQVLANLLSNAAKYTPPGGRIDLMVDTSPSEITLRVVDEGIGMSNALAARAFDLFSQAERTSDRVQGGLGIGLSIVKSLVELHGGSVTAFSAGADTGSTFTVRLPRLFPPTAFAPNPDAPEQAASPYKLNILVVDDNVDAADMLALFLRAIGHHVTVSYYSAQALQQVQIAVPDVCLLDLGLPEMDGNALVRQMQLLTPLHDTVFIAVTGYGQMHDKENAFRASFHHHFTKPVDSTQLSTLLEKISTTRNRP